MVDIFRINGLTVKGTQEQYDLYFHDEHAYDYIKAAMNHMIKHAEQYAEKDVTIRNARIGFGKRLIIVNQNEDNTDIRGQTLTKVGLNTKLFVYNHTNGFSNEITIDELEKVKDENYLPVAFDSIGVPINNGLSDDLKKELITKYNKLEQSQKLDDITYKPQPLDNSKQSLTSNKGFYVGDPALVLKDDILKRGVKEGAEVQTGIYNINGQKMVITHATNGCHGGHDIYSGTIGVIPLELIDKNKIKSLPADSLDIRTGNSMNVIVKQNKMYLAQADIDEIDTRAVDVLTKAQSMQYDM